MSCDEVRLALPLLEGGDPAEAERVRAHCKSCPGCAALLALHAADERALAAARAGRAAPAVLDGFTARVMAQVAAERAAGRALGPAAPLPATEVAAAAPGSITRFPFVRLAMAAGLLLAVALGVGHGQPAPTGPGPVVASTPAPAPAARPIDPLAAAPAPVAPAPVGTASAPAPRTWELAGSQLPAPRRVAPGVRRSRPDGVVPVGGRGGQAAGEDQLLELMERAWPGLQRRLLDGRRPSRGDVREVRF